MSISEAMQSTISLITTNVFFHMEIGRHVLKSGHWPALNLLSVGKGFVITKHLPTVE